MQDNLHQFVKQKSLKSKEKIGGNILKNIFDSKGESVRGGTVFLRTDGKNLPVSLSAVKRNKPRFSHENLKRLQVLLGNSDRAIKKTVTAVRKVFGRRSIDPGFEHSLTLRNKLEVVPFGLKKKPTHPGEKIKPKDQDGLLDYAVEGVATPDFDELVKTIIAERGADPGDVEVYCGLDNGQGFTKIGFVVRHKMYSEIDS